MRLTAALCVVPLATACRHAAPARDAERTPARPPASGPPPGPARGPDAPAAGDPTAGHPFKFPGPETLANGLPPCAAPAVATAGWPVHRLRGAAGTLRLPPSYAPDPLDAGAAPARQHQQGWTGPGGGGVMLAPVLPSGSAFWIPPSAGEALVGRPASCAQPVAGSRARVTRYAFARPGAADTSYVVTFDAPGGGGRQLGALALHRRAAGRDSLLAALATLEVGP
jgi:hypothetical protein